MSKNRAVAVSRLFAVGILAALSVPSSRGNLVSAWILAPGGIAKAEPAEAKPTISRAVGPVRPGETAMLVGEWPVTAGVEVARIAEDGGTSDLRWHTLTPFQVDGQSMKFTIPAAWSMGAYGCRVVDATGVASEPALLNQADPWWLLGDGGARAASPGGWIRIFGTALHLDVPSRVRLKSGGRQVELAAEKGKEAGGYSLSVAVPATMASAIYAVSVHNGLGGRDSWTDVGHIEVGLPQPWNREVFDVNAFGDVSESATAVVRAALQKAAACGGGVVFFPRGRYRITDTLVIPPRVTLKGEGEAVVSLHWPAREKPLESLIRGSDDFSVEDLSLYTRGIHKHVISGRDNVSVRRVRIRANFFFRHDFVGKANPRLEDGQTIVPVSETSNRAGAGVHITGNNATIVDCDIHHSRFGLVLDGSVGGVVARNRLDCGQGGFQTYCISRVVIEENEMAGAALWASGNAISLYHGGAASHVYFARNRIRQVYGGDREALTTDGHGTAYFGRVAGVDGVRVTLADDSWWGNANKDMIRPEEFQKTLERQRPAGEFASDPWHGVSLFILGGRGVGQYRNVMACNARDVQLERPFAIAPDSSSVVSIGKFQGRHLLVGNEFRDCKQAIQLYAPCCDCIVAENQIWRADCMNSGAIFTGGGPNSSRSEPGWFNQFLANHVWEGNGWADNSMELLIQGMLRISSKDPAIRSLAPSIGHVIRDNAFDNNASIRVQGDVRNVIIEHNRVQNCDHGVRVGRANATSPLPDAVWIGDNTFPNVGTPIDAPGAPPVDVPANR